MDYKRCLNKMQEKLQKRIHAYILYLFNSFIKIKNKYVKIILQNIQLPHY